MKSWTGIDVRSETSPAAVGAHIIAACREARVVHVRADANFGVETAFWDEVLDKQADRVAVDENAATGDPTGALWSTVSFDPALQHTFRHSSSAQPLHTDGSYVRDPPDIVFMVCKRAAKAGGATLFLDGCDLVDSLRLHQPDLLRLLAMQPLCFSKADSAVSSAVLTLAENGPLLRWNYYAARCAQSPAALAVADAFHGYLESAVKSGAVRSLTLQPGEAVFFHDQRLLHGRERFSADAPQGRFLWKGGLRL